MNGFIDVWRDRWLVEPMVYLLCNRRGGLIDERADG